MMSDDDKLKTYRYDLLKSPPSKQTCEPPYDVTLFENTPLYTLIAQQTKVGMRKAWECIYNMNDFEFKKRSLIDRSTYLHHIVNQAPKMYEKYYSVIDLIPLIYHLAIRGVVVNAQNNQGNTCLHLAMWKPNAQSLLVHLLRIGVDPCISNNHNCTILHKVEGHKFRIVKNETNIRSGLWYAVQNEEMIMTEKLLKTWCRVNVIRSKSLIDVAENTNNDKIVNLLKVHQLTNEMVCAAFACRTDLIKKIVSQGIIDWKQNDEAWLVPKPLVVSLADLGFWSKDVIMEILKFGATSGEQYLEKIELYKKAFENSEFYKLLEENTITSISKAADLILDNKLDLNLVSLREETKHWTYVHYVVNKSMNSIKNNWEKFTLHIRCLYRMALAGINMNERAANGDTPLLMSTKPINQQFLCHLLRLGCDSTICNLKGECLSTELYFGRGRFTLTKKYIYKNLPGIVAAVKAKNIKSVEMCLRSGARVNCKLDNRNLLDVAASRGLTQISELLKKYRHVNEFYCATIASDYQRVVNIIALGNGSQKVNAVNEFFLTGSIKNYRSERISRPLIIDAMIYSTPQIVEYLLKSKANLATQYEERTPCGPLALWAFQDLISNDITLVIVKYAEVTLRDEMGCTMLHRIVTKKRTEGKIEVVKVLLQRNINVAAREENGLTARDYTFRYNMEKSEEIRQILDDFVLELVKLDNLIELEQLVLNAYDHIQDIKDSSKKKTALEIAESKLYYEMQMFLKKMDSYFLEISILQKAVISGNMVDVSKHAMERKCAQCIDRGGRTLLHLAILFERLEVIKYLLDYFPNLISRTDNLGRTALHYCVCLEDRLNYWPTLQDAGAEPADADASNLTVYDYVKQLKNPILKHQKTVARSWRNYTPSFNILEDERAQVMYELYGVGERKPIRDVESLSSIYDNYEKKKKSFFDTTKKTLNETKKESILKPQMSIIDKVIEKEEISSLEKKLSPAKDKDSSKEKHEEIVKKDSKPKSTDSLNKKTQSEISSNKIIIEKESTEANKEIKIKNGSLANKMFNEKNKIATKKENKAVSEHGSLEKEKKSLSSSKHTTKKFSLTSSDEKLKKNNEGFPNNFSEDKEELIIKKEIEEISYEEDEAEVI